MNDAARIRPKELMLFRDGFGKGPIVAIQDPFGKLYRHLYQHHRPGEIIGLRSFEDVGRTGVGIAGTNGDGTNQSNFRILAKADLNEVRAIAQRAKVKNHLLEGLWYECISD